MQQIETPRAEEKKDGWLTVLNPVANVELSPLEAPF